MDNCITDILDNGIKEMQFNKRTSSAITYQLGSNDKYSNKNNILIEKGKNKIIDKTMSLLSGNAVNQNDRFDTNALNKQRERNNNTNSNRKMAQGNQRQYSKEKINKSKNNNVTGTTIKKGKSINWEKQFEELRQKAEEAKKSLVNERKKGKELEKQFNRLTKKEQQYNELIEVNQKMLQTNESLYKKVEANDRIVQEQEEIIQSLQLEIKRYMGIYDTNTKSKNNHNQA